MRLTIKNAKAAHVDPATEPYRLHVDIDGIEAEDLLANVDIITAIEYYGITELLDTIGEGKLKLHLKFLQGDANDTQ